VHSWGKVKAVFSCKTFQDLVKSKNVHTWSQQNLLFDIYDQWDYFNFTIINFPYTCSNIPRSPAYDMYISHLIRYARACSTCEQILNRGRLLTDKLIIEGFLQYRLMSAFSKIYSYYNDLIPIYKLSLSHMLCDIFHSNRKTTLGTLTLTAHSR
jgi:hypothetical protein